MLFNMHKSVFPVFYAFSGNCKPSSHLCFSLLHVNNFLMQIMLLSFQVFFVVLIKTGNTSSCLYTW